MTESPSRGLFGFPVYVPLELLLAEVLSGAGPVGLAAGKLKDVIVFGVAAENGVSLSRVEEVQMEDVDNAATCETVEFAKVGVDGT